jgi:hypothetical protein
MSPFGLCTKSFEDKILTEFIMEKLKNKIAHFNLTQMIIISLLNN